jgi:hypothetical protein
LFASAYSNLEGPPVQATILPTTRQLRNCSTQEISDAGGQVLDVFDDGTRLFLRSILAATWEVRPKDGFQGGVALRTTEREVLVHPYVFRQVCRNGAIVAQAIQTRRVDRVEETPFADPEEAVREALAEVAAAVQECCAPEIFAEFTNQLRTACELEADLVIQLAPQLVGLPRQVAAQLFADIDRRFTKEGDRSLYGLTNAVTVAARDTRDPEMRWRLEEIGGGIPALLEPRVRPQKAGVALAV